MSIGSHAQNDFDRVTQKMADNQMRDASPSLLSLIGSEEKVMNLRPL